MNLILLSGGSGQRLWPLSNNIRSKQFVPLLKNAKGEYESMVQRVYRQGVKHHDLLIRHAVLPVNILINIHLDLIYNPGGHYFSFRLQHKKVIPLKSLLRRFSDGIDTTDPAGSGKTFFFIVVDTGVDLFNSVKI